MVILYCNFIELLISSNHFCVCGVFIVDIQDLWPEAFRMALNIPIISNLVFLPYKKKADRIYSRADGIIAVSETYVQRAMSVNSKCSIGHSVYIGINLSAFDRNSQGAKKKNDGILRLAYCGSLDLSYDIKTVMDALTLLENPPRFVVMGAGSQKEVLENYARDKAIDVEFTGYLPYAEMCKKLCECDLTVNPIIGTSVASIINKHGDYAASGLPVINTQNSKEYRKLVEDYNMGLNCENGDAERLAECIQQLIVSPELRREMGINARRCAEEKFDRQITYQEIINTIRLLVSQTGKTRR